MTPTYFAPKEFLEAAYAALESAEETGRVTTEDDFESIRRERTETYAETLTDIASASVTYATAYSIDGWEFDGCGTVDA